MGGIAPRNPRQHLLHREGAGHRIEGLGVFVGTTALPEGWPEMTGPRKRPRHPSGRGPGRGTRLGPPGLLQRCARNFRVFSGHYPLLLPSISSPTSKIHASKLGGTPPRPKKRCRSFKLIHDSRFDSPGGGRKADRLSSGGNLGLRDDEDALRPAKDKDWKKKKNRAKKREERMHFFLITSPIPTATPGGAIDGYAPIRRNSAPDTSVTARTDRAWA